MKVLTATMRGNGEVAGDYSFCVPGELVWLPPSCDRDRVDPDNGCGCGRGFGGLSSHRATTTALVEERPWDPSELYEAVRSSLHDQGWLLPTDRGREEMVCDVVSHIRDIAEHFAVATVVRRRMDEVYAHVDHVA